MDAPEPSARSTPALAPLRVGVIGTGGISRAHAPGWIAAGAELHCHSHDGAEDFARAYGATAHEDLEGLLAAVDAVDICTPTSTHAELAHRALDAGCDVVCEKPLALTDAECAGLLDHAERAGRTLLPAHVVRWFPQYHAAREAIRAGEIGELAVLRFERTGSFPAQPWFADDSRSGGMVMDQMIHDLDQAVWMAGPATSVYARQALAGDGGTVRTAHVVLTHASGAISHCRGLWGPHGTRFRYTFDLAGSGGRLRYDSTADSGIAVDAVAGARQTAGDGFLPEATTFEDPYAAEIRAFAQVLRDGGTTRVDAADGAEAVRLSRLALESLRTGRSLPC